ncbi:unnamed protein product [Ilex paraguariensis]|uniref:Uncharacterized protein n=1 Tax=Ilex paraguariensis TaxID=185542 RepID=A0ABC8S1T8_9AQUA
MVENNKQKGDQNVKAIGMNNDSGLVGEDYDSDKLQSLRGSSDEDETGGERVKYPHFNAKADMVMELEKWANSNRVVDLYVEHSKACILNPSQAESTCGNGVASKSSSDKDKGESSGSEYFYDNEYDTENSQLYENAVDDDSNFKGDQNVKAIGMNNDSGLVGEDYDSDKLQSLRGSSDEDETGGERVKVEQHAHRASKGWRVLENDQQVMELEKWANSNRVVDLYVEHSKACILNPSQAESTCGNGVASKSSSDKDKVDSEECS